MGSSIGAFYGQRIVDYAHAHPDNRVDRFFLPRPNEWHDVVPGQDHDHLRAAVLAHSLWPRPVQRQRGLNGRRRTFADPGP